MITLTGKYNTANIYSSGLESSAEGQIKKLLDQEFVRDSKIRIMPDVHAGAGCAIGTTMTIADKVVPNLVGVDIGCGMEVITLAEKRLNLPELDSFIHGNIPAGMNIRISPHKYLRDINLNDLICARQLNIKRGELSLGTLGGGNHFIEVDKDDDSNLYLIIHSGSRNIGLQVAKYYQDKAFASMEHKEEIPFSLAYCEGELLDDYLHDMALMQKFAQLNRQAIADDIVKACKCKVDERFSTIHNYIDLDNRILRKGAVSAQLGEVLLIPINMRDGALICKGLGNPDWNYSAPHGAGRLMSRSDAKSSFTLSAFKKEMDGVFSSTINAETLDECPMAYKDLDEIVSQSKDTVSVIKRIRPIYSFKAGENQVVKSRKSKSTKQHYTRR